MDDQRDVFDHWLATGIKSVQAQARSAVAAPRPDLESGGRATRLLGSVLATAAVVAVAGVALVTHHTTGTPATPPVSGGFVVPWKGLDAQTPTGPFTSPGIEPCAASTLAITATGSPYVGSGPANTSFWHVTVRDIGKSTCFIGPSLDVTFLTPSGSIQLPRATGGPSGDGDIIYLTPPSPTSSNTDAFGEIDTGCLPAGTRLAVSPGPTLGSITVDPGPPGGSVAPCAHPSGSYHSSLSSCCTDGPPRALPLAQAVLDAPTTVHPGERLRFLVTVKDSAPEHFGVQGPGEPTPAPIALDPCPTYQEELEGVAGSVAAYALNCGEARPIASGGSETFEMFIDVPADAHPGPAVLAWRFITPNNLAHSTRYLEIVP